MGGKGTFCQETCTFTQVFSKYGVTAILTHPASPPNETIDGLVLDCMCLNKVPTSPLERTLRAV